MSVAFMIDASPSEGLQGLAQRAVRIFGAHQLPLLPCRHQLVGDRVDIFRLDMTLYQEPVAADLAQLCRRRAIVEDMAEMAAAGRAMHLRPHRAVAAIGSGLDSPSTGSSKPGQPVPLSNLLADSNRGWPQPAQPNRPGRFSSSSA
jgi:hypothetical protein